MEHMPQWIRIAGHTANIKANHPHGWRCYIKGNPTEIALKNWSVSGLASHRNFIPGIKSDKDEHGLVAWIDCFGSYAVENEVLHIILREPDASPQV